MNCAILTSAAADPTCYAVLTDGKEFSSFKNEGHVIVSHVFRRIPLYGGFDEGGKEMKEPSG